MRVTLDEVRSARRRIEAYVQRTPVVGSALQSQIAGRPVSLKLENLQATGSFKIRGAVNALLQLPRGTPIVAASAGNHGRAIACAAEQLGFAATVFTPRDAPRVTIDAIRRHHAQIDLDSSNYDEAERRAQEHAARRGATFVSPYTHPHVIAGGGTLGLELLEQSPEMDTLVAPVGGGGLISGLAIALRGSHIRVRIIGVEANASPAFTASLRAGRPVTIDAQPTLADGLSGNLDPGTPTFDIVREMVDEIVTVSEKEIQRAVHQLATEDHVVAEGAGAAAAAAVLCGRVGLGRCVVVLVSGGNIDPARLATLLSAP